MSDERRGDGEAEGPPPPSPLTGGYLLVLLPQLHSSAHKDRLLHALTKGLITWDAQECHVDLDKELQNITAQAPEGEEAKNGERLIQFASENLVTEVLIHPQLNTLVQCMRNCLSSFTRHRHIIHAGYTSAGNGAWVLQDGTYSFSDFADMYSEHEVQRVLRAYEGTVSVDVHCSGEGDWWALKAKDPFSKVSRVRLNPPDKGTTTTAVRDFLNYLSQYLVPAGLNDLLEPSDVVGNIRFSHPTLYVFPGGQGDAALFGINGFNMLVDGGFSRKACFWDFTRHLDRLDSVLMTRINNGNLQGLASLLKRKKSEQVYPQIGHFFSNIPDRKQVLSPDGDKDRDPLLINLIEQGQEMLSGLRHLGLRPQACYREPSVEPINLYHKVGHGKLDMYVLSPAKDSREVREFLAKWAAVDSKIFCSYSRKGEFNFPLSSKTSICALLVWQPANPEDNITRLLFPGSTPQQKIFEGLDRLKNLEFMKHPICSAKSLSPTSSTIKLSIKPTPKPAIIEKVAEIEKKPSETVKAVKQVGEIKKSTPPPSKPKPKADRPKEKPKTDLDSKPETVKIDKKTTEAVQKVEKEVKKEKPKRTMQKPQEKKTQKQPEKKTDSVKSSPTTPKKTVENKLTEMAATRTEMKTRASKAKASPTSTPAKSAKEENNRKVVELKSRESTKLQKAPPTKKEEPKKVEKSVGKKSTASPKGVKSLSPIKAAKQPAKQRLDVKKSSKTEKDIITDSSAVSTPSTVDAELTKAKEEAEKTKEIRESKPEDSSRKASEDIGKSISKDEDDEILIIEKVEISDEITGKADVEKIALHLQKLDEEKKKIPKEQKASAIDEKETADTLSQEKTVGDTLPSPETKQVAQEEVQDIIETATEIVTKRLDIQKTDSQEISGKDLGSTDRMATSKEKDIKSVDVEQKIDESQPDERFSTTVESGATTTAPTLPEDERIPLDEIKEGIEEKYVKEETKEKEIIATPRPEQLTSLPQVPVIAGTVFDQRAQLLKDIVKTPDEVADLPVHEEVDVGIYEGAGKDELLSLPSAKKEKKDDTTEELKLFKDNLEKEDKSKDLKEDMVESVDVLSHTTTDLDMISSSPKSGKPLESDEKEEVQEDEKLEYKKEDGLEKKTEKVSGHVEIEKEQAVKLSRVDDQVLDKPEESKEITEKETIESKEKEEIKAKSVAKLHLEEVAKPSSTEEIETEKDEGVCLDETTPQYETKESIVTEEKVEERAQDSKEDTRLEEEHTKEYLMETEPKDSEKKVDEKLVIKKEIDEIAPETVQESQKEEQKILETEVIKLAESTVSEEKSVTKEVIDKQKEDQKPSIEDHKEKIESDVGVDLKLEKKDTIDEEIDIIGRKTIDETKPSELEKGQEEDEKKTSSESKTKIESTSLEELEKGENELEESKQTVIQDTSVIKQETVKDIFEKETDEKTSSPGEKTLASEIAESEKIREMEHVKPVVSSFTGKDIGDIISADLKKTITKQKEEITQAVIKKADECELEDLQKTESEPISTKDEIKPLNEIEETEDKKGIQSIDKDKSAAKVEAIGGIVEAEVSGKIKSETEESLKTEIQETVEDIEVQKVVAKEIAMEVKEGAKLIAEVEKIETKTESTETITKAKVDTQVDQTEDLEKLRLEQSVLVNGLIKEEMILSDSLASDNEIEHVGEDITFKKTVGEELESATKQLSMISSEPDEIGADQTKQPSSSIIDKDIKAEIKAMDLTAETLLTADTIKFEEKLIQEDMKDVIKPEELKVKDEIKPSEENIEFEAKLPDEKKEAEIKITDEKKEIEEKQELETKSSIEKEEVEIKLSEEKKEVEIKSTIDKKEAEIKPAAEMKEAEVTSTEEKETEMKQSEEKKEESEIKSTKDKKEAEVKSAEEKKEAEVKLAEEKKEAQIETTEEKKESEVKSVEEKKEAVVKLAVEKKEVEVKSTEEKKEAEIKTIEEKKETEIKMTEEKKEADVKLSEEIKEAEIKTFEEKKDAEIKMTEEKKEAEEKKTEEKKEEEKLKEVDIKPSEERKKADIKPSEEVKEAEIKSSEETKEAEIISSEETKEAEIKPSEEVKEVKIKPSEEIKEAEIKPSEEIKDAEIKPSEDIKEADIKPSEEIKEVEIKTIEEKKEAQIIETEEKKESEIKITEEKKEGEVKITEEKREPEVKSAEEKKEADIIMTEEKKDAEIKMTEEKKDVEIKMTEEKKDAEVKSAEEKKEAEIKMTEEKKETEIIMTEEKKDVEIKMTEEKKDAEVKSAEEKKEAEVKSAEEKKEAEIKITEEKKDAEIKITEEKKEAEVKLAEEKKAAELKSAEEKKEAEVKSAEEKKEAEVKSAEEKKEAEIIMTEEKKDAEIKITEEKKDTEVKSAEEKKAAELKSAEEKKEAEVKSAEEKKEAEVKSTEEKKEAEIIMTEEKKDAEIKMIEEKKDAEVKSAEEKIEAEIKMTEEKKEAEIKMTEEKKDVEKKQTEEKIEGFTVIPEMEGAEMKIANEMESTEDKLKEVDMKLSEETKGVEVDETKLHLQETSKELKIKQLDEIILDADDKKVEETKPTKEEDENKKEDILKQIEEKGIFESDEKVMETDITKIKKEEDMKPAEREKEAVLDSKAGIKDVAIKEPDEKKGTEIQLEEKQEVELTLVKEIEEAKYTVTEETKEEYKKTDVSKEDEIHLPDEKIDIERKSADDKKEIESKSAKEKKENHIKSAGDKKDIELKSADRKKEIELRSAEEMKDIELRSVEERKDIELRSAEEKEDAQLKIAEEKEESQLKIAEEKKEAEIKTDTYLKENKIKALEKDATKTEFKSAEDIKETRDIELKSAGKEDAHLEKEGMDKDMGIKGDEVKQNGEKKEIELKSAEDKKEIELKSAEDKKEIELKSAEEKMKIELKSADEKEEIVLKSAEEKKEIELKLADKRMDIELKSTAEKKEIELKSAEENELFEISAEKKELEIKTGTGLEEEETKLTEEKKDSEVKSVEEKISLTEDVQESKTKPLEDIKDKIALEKKETDIKPEAKPFDDIKLSKVISDEEKGEVGSEVDIGKVETKVKLIDDIQRDDLKSIVGKEETDIITADVKKDDEKMSSDDKLPTEMEIKKIEVGDGKDGTKVKLAGDDKVLDEMKQIDDNKEADIKPVEDQKESVIKKESDVKPTEEKKVDKPAQEIKMEVSAIKQDLGKEEIKQTVITETKMSEIIPADEKQPKEEIKDQLGKGDLEMSKDEIEVLSDQETKDIPVKPSDDSKLTEIQSVIEKDMLEAEAEKKAGISSITTLDSTKSLHKAEEKSIAKDAVAEEMVLDKTLVGDKPMESKHDIEKGNILSEEKKVEDFKTDQKAGAVEGTVKLEKEPYEEKMETETSLLKEKTSSLIDSSSEIKVDKILHDSHQPETLIIEEKRELSDLMKAGTSLSDSIVVNGQKEIESKTIGKIDEAESMKTFSVKGRIESETSFTIGIDTMIQQKDEMKLMSGEEREKPESESLDMKLIEKAEIKPDPEHKEIIEKLEHSIDPEAKPTDSEKEIETKLPEDSKDSAVKLTDKGETIVPLTREKEEPKGGLSEDKEKSKEKREDEKKDISITDRETKPAETGTEIRTEKPTKIREDFEFLEESIDKPLEQKKDLLETEDKRKISPTIKSITESESIEVLMMKASEIKISEKKEHDISEYTELQAKEIDLSKTITTEKDKTTSEEQIGYVVSSKLSGENGHHHEDMLEEFTELQQSEITKSKFSTDTKTEGKALSSKTSEEVFTGIEKKMSETTFESHSRETIQSKTVEDKQGVLSSELSETVLKTDNLDEKSSDFTEKCTITSTSQADIPTEGPSSSSRAIIKEENGFDKPKLTQLPRAEKGALDSSIKEDKTDKIKDETIVAKFSDDIKESISQKEEFSTPTSMKEIETTTSKEHLSMGDQKIKESTGTKVNGFTDSKVTSEYEVAISTQKLEGISETTSKEYREIRSEQKEMVVQEITDLPSSVKVEKDTANADLKSKMKDEKQIDTRGFSEDPVSILTPDKKPSTGEIMEEYSLKYANGDKLKSEEHSKGSSETTPSSKKQDETHLEQTTAFEKTTFTNGKIQMPTDEIKSISEVETKYSESSDMEGITTITTITKTITTTLPEDLKDTDPLKNGTRKTEEAIVTTETKSLGADKPIGISQNVVSSTSLIEGTTEKSEQVCKVEKIVTEKHEIESVKDVSVIKAKLISEVTPALNGSSVHEKDSMTSTSKTETILNGSFSEPKKTIEQSATEATSMSSETQDKIKSVSSTHDTKVLETIKTEKSKISLELEKSLETSHRDKTTESVKEISEASSSQVSTESKQDTLKDLSMIKDMTSSFISTERWTDRRTDTPEGRATPSSEATWRESDDDLPPSPLSTTSHLHSPPPAMYSSMYAQDDDSDISFGKPDIDFETAAREHVQTRGETLPKDPIEKWGKPLGLPPPPSGKDYWSPFKEWGRPLHLPSPAPAPTENDTEDTSGSAKTTPKKVAKMNEENNRYASNIMIGKEANNKNRRSDSPVKRNMKDSKKAGMGHIYLDLSYVPHHGNSHYANVEFFKRVRARYYVFSGTEPSKEVFNALLEAKQQWEDKDLEVTIIPTYDTDTLGYWIAENEETLSKYKIDLSPSASRCTINLQDHDTSCSAYRLEF